MKTVSTQTLKDFVQINSNQILHNRHQHSLSFFLSLSLCTLRTPIAVRSKSDSSRIQQQDFCKQN